MLRAAVAVAAFVIAVTGCSSVSSDCRAANVNAAQSWTTVVQDADNCRARIPEGDLTGEVTRFGLSSCSDTAQKFIETYGRNEALHPLTTTISVCRDEPENRCLHAGVGLEDSYQAAQAVSEAAWNACR